MKDNDDTGRYEKKKRKKEEAAYLTRVTRSCYQ